MRKHPRGRVLGVRRPGCTTPDLPVPRKTILRLRKRGWLRLTLWSSGPDTLEQTCLLHHFKISGYTKIKASANS